MTVSQERLGSLWQYSNYFCLLMSTIKQLDNIMVHMFRKILSITLLQRQISSRSTAYVHTWICLHTRACLVGQEMGTFIGLVMLMGTGQLMLSIQYPSFTVSALDCSTAKLSTGSLSIHTVASIIVWTIWTAVQYCGLNCAARANNAVTSYTLWTQHCT